MINNIHLGPVAGVGHAIALLRAENFVKPVQPAVVLVPGIEFQADPEADLRGTITSVPGEVVALDVAPNGPVRWISLGFDLGIVALTDLQILGVFCRTQAAKSVTFRMVLRSTIEGGFVDTMWRKTVVAFQNPSIHMDALDFSREPGIPRPATRRELILLLPQEAFALHLLNFGVFAA